jgi:iron complex transport system ATP-binding protein
VSPGLAFEGASVGYDAPVVSDVTLQVRPGEMVGLIGPNGAGKTTLVRSVTGGARIFSGAVSVGERPVGEYSRSGLARLVAVLPQTLPTSFAFTAKQFVEMGRHAHVSRFGDLGPSDHAAVERALMLTDTGGLAHRRVDELSGGDLQRLTLAQALAQEPSVLLLDEPTSHLDLNHRLQVLDVVRSLVDSGLAVLAVFHDLDMAARYSDRLAVVVDGEVASQGSPEQVLTGQTLAGAFGVAAVIGRDPVTGTVQVLPVMRSEGAAVAQRGVRVHVVSGSGTGASIMRRLVLEGFEVTAGALSPDDTDGAVGEALGLAMRRIAPFAAMSAEDDAAVRDLADRADVVVAVATPYGPENLGNLRAIAHRASATVLVGALTPEMDFSRGEATATWNTLASAGARACADPRELVRCIEEVVRR